MFILGFLRLISGSLSSYHVSDIEYGSHWNFFFTFGMVRLLSPTTRTKHVRPIFVALSLLAAYHCSLKFGLETWILSQAPRNNLLSANREGIFSLLGYVALDYAAVELVDYMKRPKTVFKDWLHLSVILTSLAVAGWISLPLCQAILGYPSRRLANASFCFWMMTYNVTLLAAFVILDLFLFSLEFGRQLAVKQIHQPDMPIVEELPVVREPCVLTCINNNGLLYFLLANVLTGLVNFACDTSSMHQVSSMLILASYCSLLTVPVVLYLWKLRT